MVNYATKSDLKNATGVDTSEFAKKTDLAKLKWDIGKLETTSADLSSLSNVTEKEVIKRDVHDELVKKVNVIQSTDTSDLVKKDYYNTKIDEIEKKIPNHA